ncbi:hypothetical protein SAY87_010667 [Trapa incisa]|uniref:Cysteine-rich receptor-like protein kinase 42 n=1 Tax=Trapa incisa TaxID=236973 RepID=A0AAN7JIC6_9MYRT|nr:hypothetical protein SAY87_010667 [Trapa incisa]
MKMKRRKFSIEMEVLLPIPNQDLLLILYASYIFFLSPALSDPRIQEVELQCGTLPSNLSIIPNFGIIMREIANQVTNHSWGSASISQPLPELYGLVQCHGDLNQSDCLLCFAQGRTRLPACIPSMGRLYLDGCFQRFDSYNFFNESTDPKHDNCTCTVPASTLTKSTEALFKQRVVRVLKNVTTTAVSNRSYAVAGEEDTGGGNLGAYALAQCWSTVSNSGCRACLEDAVSKIKGCLPGTDGRAMNAGCFLRYSTNRFYNIPNKGGSSDSNRTILLACIAAAVGSLAIISLFVGYRKLAKMRRVRRNAIWLPRFMSKSNLNFKYETLERATNYFDEARKLGEGGAGSVYKGILPSGKVVAVKRLVYNTRQWADDFFNEVNLINEIQHRNLVRLLGCSIEGPESLLVYEYVPNRSLDQVLFANDVVRVLNWDERFHIIVGTAEGLAYLHCGFGMKIIHRDIKASNILLDENFTAKIADFGLARCMAPDRSHITTGIAGTLGYMAPEYLIKAQLTEKADVYSFGVLVLEILTRRKNTMITEGLGSVLQSVWRDYRLNTLHESIDPALGVDFLVKDATRVLQIGLLCTQALGELRPSMAQVVEMLKDKHYPVPSPKQPPFLSSGMLSTDNSTRSSSTTTISNQLSEVSSIYTTRSSAGETPRSKT